MKFLFGALTVGLAVLFYFGAAALAGAIWPQLANDFVFNIALGAGIGLLTGRLMGRLTS